MTPETSRRGFVRICAAGGAGAVGAGESVVGAVPGVETDSPAADPADRSRLTPLDDLETTVEELRAELERRRQERRADLSTMPAETKQ